MADRPKESIDAVPELRLERHQQALLNHLGQADESRRLAKMYRSALTVLNSDGIPDHVALAAHNIRELMEKLPRYLAVPTTAHNESLMYKVNHLCQFWEPVRGIFTEEISDNTHEDNPAFFESLTSGTRASLQKFLKEFQNSFSWKQEHRPTRKQESLRFLEKWREQRSESLNEDMESQVDIWKGLNTYFQDVAHHRSRVTASKEEFEDRLFRLESFLIGQPLAPGTPDSQIIDGIIKDAESND